MSVMDFLMGSSQLPSYLKQMNQATAQYNQDQMAANQANWTQAQSATQLGANSDIGYATATGAYLNANPYINQIANNTASSIISGYNNSQIPDLLSQYAASGRYGSGGMQNALTSMQSSMNSDIASAVNDLYYTNYNTERGYMENAQDRLGTQYDPLNRYNAYSGVINAGQYSTIDDTDETYGLLDVWGKMADATKTSSEAFNLFFDDKDKNTDTK